MSDGTGGGVWCGGEVYAAYVCGCTRLCGGGRTYPGALAPPLATPGPASGECVLLGTRAAEPERT